MFWRAAAAISVLFWAVMTGLLVRDAYFPDESRFTEVPPRLVLDLFLKQAELNTDTLHLYHRDEKIGHASLKISSSGSGDVKAYAWVARGMIERLQEKSEPENVTWEFSGLMQADGNWTRMELLAAMPRQEASLSIVWEEGERLPQVNLTQGGKTMLDSNDPGLAMALRMADGETGWLQSLASTKTASADSPVLRLTAREGSLELAGRERKCYLVTAPLPGDQEIRMIFGETGELARVDLPQGYRLLEPLIHGMIPPLSKAATPP
ncbi:MAG: hypothetical protein HS117_14315 [Verrucomicrobiaceae bacterium]|nr:hypothetical protein [Verrucomicrobiaceae bacterium]